MTEIMKYCNKCGHESKVTARYCEKCGNPLFIELNSCNLREEKRQKSHLNGIV
ncbi:MAG: zinc-ribbon domain-containing protein [Candidatus Aenigmarchaeota archaeon]|nr:zinc-ribbon domain-containing protein [Candidatus Aenigmarchaeota archaeon]